MNSESGLFEGTDDRRPPHFDFMIICFLYDARRHLTMYEKNPLCPIGHIKWGDCIRAIISTISLLLCQKIFRRATLFQNFICSNCLFLLYYYYYYNYYSAIADLFFLYFRRFRVHLKLLKSLQLKLTMTTNIYEVLQTSDLLTMPSDDIKYPWPVFGKKLYLEILLIVNGQIFLKWSSCHTFLNPLNMWKAF